MSKLIQTIAVIMALLTTPTLAGWGGSAKPATALHNAARDGNTQKVIALIKGGANIEARSKGGTTPLHYAAGNGSVEAVTALIKGGANIEARSKRGHTPLHYAGWGGSAETVNALLNAGADASARSKRRATAFYLAKEYNQKNLKGTAAWWRLKEAQ